MEENCYTERYDLMCITEKIGEFSVEYGERGRVFSIILDTDLSGNDIHAKLYVLQENNVIDDEGVRFFMSHRVMPRNRINGDRLLRAMGLSEYDQYEIFKYNNGACGKDYFWVKFSPELTFYDVNIRAEQIIKMSGDVIEELRKKKIA